MQCNWRKLYCNDKIQVAHVSQSVMAKQTSLQSLLKFQTIKFWAMITIDLEGSRWDFVGSTWSKFMLDKFLFQQMKLKHYCIMTTLHISQQVLCWLATFHIGANIAGSIAHTVAHVATSSDGSKMNISNMCVAVSEKYYHICSLMALADNFLSRGKRNHFMD